MKRTLLGISSATLVAALAAFLVGGFPLVADGFLLGKDTLIRALPMVVIAFLLTGQLQSFLKAAWIDQQLQKFSGLKGIVASAAAGGLFPGGPYIFYPFIAGFKDKNIPFYLIFSFINGKLIYDVTRIPMEVSLINPWIALLRNILTLPVPIAMGLLSRRFIYDGSAAGYFKKEGT